MSAELIKLPNVNLKILRSNINTIPDFLQFPIFQSGFTIFNFLHKNSKIRMQSEEIDILIILLHLYFTNKEKDGLLYINTDDILTFRSIRKNKAGYKKEVRKRIASKISTVQKTGIFNFIDYNNFNFIFDLNYDYIKNIKKLIPVNQKLLALNPATKSWHKTIGLYLTILKYNLNCNTKHLNTRTVQVKKLLKILPYNKASLFPFQIRQRFEETLDELNLMGIFKGWHYKNIDEETLNSKNWLHTWKLLSIRISFR